LKQFTLLQEINSSPLIVMHKFCELHLIYASHLDKVYMHIGLYWFLVYLSKEFGVSKPIYKICCLATWLCLLYCA